MLLHAFHNVPTGLWIGIAVIALFALCRPTPSRRVSTWGRFDAYEDDEQMLGQPLRVRHGVVLERSEVQVPKFYGNRMHRPQQILETQLAFVILCNDKVGHERIEVTESKTSDNAYANIGRSVEVRSYRSSVHSEDACDRVVVVG